MSVHAPVVVWSRGPLRIVAVEREVEGRTEMRLCLETRGRDQTGGEAWYDFSVNNDLFEERVFGALLCEIALKTEVGLSLWVTARLAHHHKAVGEMEVITDGADDRGGAA